MRRVMVGVTRPEPVISRRPLRAGAGGSEAVGRGL